jgi:hypothetical protein
MITVTPYNEGTLVNARMLPVPVRDNTKTHLPFTAGPLDPYVCGAGAKEKPFPTTEQFHDWSQIFGQVSTFLQETLAPTITAPVTSQPAPPPPPPEPCPITGQGRGLMPILAGVLLLILLFKE